MCSKEEIMAIQPVENRFGQLGTKPATPESAALNTVAEDRTAQATKPASFAMSQDVVDISATGRRLSQGMTPQSGESASAVPSGTEVQVDTEEYKQKQVEKLKKQIEEVQKQIQEVMSSEADGEQKNLKLKELQMQLENLQSQLMQLTDPKKQK